MGGKKVSKQVFNEWCWGWGMILPTILGIMVLNIIPIFETLYLSFFKSGAFGKGNVFVGLENYKRLISDQQVWYAVRNTLGYTLMVVPITITIAMILACCLNGKVKGKQIYRTIYFIPMVAAPAAITMVWKWLYNNQFGLINYVLTKLGFGRINWIDDPNVAMISIAIIGIW